MKPHALLCPCPSQGHINGFMQLAHHLASFDILVTFVHSARLYTLLQNHHNNSASAAQPQPQKIRIEVIPDGFDSKPKTHDDFAKFVLLMEEGLAEVVLKLSKERHPVSCIIADSFFPGTQDLANQYGIPRVEFWPSTATVYSIGFSLPRIISEGYLPRKGQNDSSHEEMEEVISGIPGIPSLRVKYFPKVFLTDDLSTPMFQFFYRMFRRAKEVKWLLVYSFHELESTAFEALRAEQIPIVAIGSLFPLNLQSSNNKPETAVKASLLREDDACLGWLGTQSTSSVLYVAFGSYASLSSSELRELALGLEASQQPFLWVIRSDGEGNTSDSLPEGFLTRTKEQGLIISWAPQQAVLAHPSVGGFLSHCGWNSTLESMYEGVPMIGCPREAEQATNLKFILEKKIGLELEVGEDGMVKEAGVVKAVRELMQGEGGVEARMRMEEMRDAVRGAAMDGSRSKTELDNFVADLKAPARSSASREEEEDEKEEEETRAAAAEGLQE